MPANLQSQIQPCVLIVARRSMRKNKFIDFVGEYHLDLIVGYGAVPLIVPRVSGIHKLLKSLEPIIHGVLLCEGEDIHPSLYENETQAAPTLSPQQLEEIRKLHCSDTSIDREKDSVEFELVKLCLEREIPYFGICRGSQMLNVVSGGTLYQDIGTQLSKTCPQTHNHVVHMDYGNYDGHRHPVKLVENTPLHHWFKDSLDNESMEILVNSYHHQGVEKLASRFVPMAFAPDGLVEGFYDPNAYNPQEGKFLVGLQFHPERMRKIDSDDFDYPGCSHVYQEFVKAVIAYQKKVNSSIYVPKPVKLDQTWKKRMSLDTTKELGIEAEAAYLESEVDLNFEQETRLMQMGATVRNSYSARIKLNEERKMVARNTMRKMSTRQLSNLVAFYGMMGQICSKVLETKLYENAGK